MTTAVVDSVENQQALAPWFFDTLVAEHRSAPEMDAVVLETTSPVDFAHPLHEDVRPRQRSSRVECLWVPDPRGEQRRVCIWVRRTGPEASAPSLES